MQGKRTQAGQVNTKQASTTISLIDKDNPTITSVSFTEFDDAVNVSRKYFPGNWTYCDITQTLDASDLPAVGCSGVSYFQYSKDNEIAVTESGKVWNSNMDSNLKFRVVDVAGNVSDWTEDYNLKITKNRDHYELIEMDSKLMFTVDNRSKDLYLDPLYGGVTLRFKVNRGFGPFRLSLPRGDEFVFDGRKYMCDDIYAYPEILLSLSEERPMIETDALKRYMSNSYFTGSVDNNGDYYIDFVWESNDTIRWGNSISGLLPTRTIHIWIEFGWNWSDYNFWFLDMDDLYFTIGPDENRNIVEDGGVRECPSYL